jgi:hypothetical protein
MTDVPGTNKLDTVSGGTTAERYSVRGYADRMKSKLNDDAPQYLVYSADRHSIVRNRRHVGGLADRLKGIYSAFLMAVATERIFLIDWEHPFALAGNLEPRAYDWQFEPHARKFSRRSEFLHLDMIDKRGDRLKETPPHLLEQEVFGGREICVININWLYDDRHLAGFDLPRTSDLAFGQVFGLLFQPLLSPDLAGRIKEVEERKKSHDGLFGVHLRTGGDKDWIDNKLDTRRSYRRLMKAAFEFANDRGSRNPLFYFASDSEKAKQSVEQRTWPHHVFTIPGPIQHLDRSQDMTRAGNDFLFFEFDLLSRCDAIIGGAGAFYSVAAMAGGKPHTTYRE